MKKLIFCLLFFLLAGCNNASKVEEKESTLEDAIVFLKDHQFDYSKDYYLSVFERCNEEEYNVSNEYFYHLENTNVYLLEQYTYNDTSHYLLTYSISLADSISEDGFDLTMYSCNLNQPVLQKDSTLHQVNPIVENAIDFDVFYEEECKRVEINDQEMILTYDDYIITMKIDHHELVSYQINYTNGTCMSTSLYSHDLDNLETQSNNMKEIIGKDLLEIEKSIPNT